MVHQERKGAIVVKFQQHKKDTGSPEVQVALLTTSDINGPQLPVIDADGQATAPIL